MPSSIAWMVSVAAALAMAVTGAAGAATAATAAPPAATAAAIAGDSDASPTAASLYDQAEARLATRATDDLESSLELFLEAARLDPSHARAHAGAATAASLLALYSVAPPRPLFATARAEARAALRIDPQLVPAQAAMGLIEYLDGWNFRGAETLFRQALGIDPEYARAWHWYGMMLMATSRFDESIAAFDRAIALEPGSSLYCAKRAGVLAAAGRAAEAERELRRLVERFPKSGLARRELGYLLVGDGRVEEGLASLREAAEISGSAADDNADLAWGYARAGRRREAKAIAARLAERASARREESSELATAEASGRASRDPSPAALGYVSPLDVALVFAGLDRRDDAFHWLDRALAIHDPGLVYLATTPGFASLRDDRRLAALLRTLGLGPGEGRERAAPAVERR